MPSLKKPAKAKRMTIPARTAVIAAETQVLVVGGGPAGMGAALGAARAGAEVIIAERYGFLGGNATAALVMPFVSYYTHRPRLEKPGSANLYPTDHGPGNPAISGAVAELVNRLVEAGGALSPCMKTGYTVPFDPEIFKSTAADMLDEAGVTFLYHAFATDVVSKDGMRGVVFETKSGPIVIRAQVIVDCTGDGDIAARAGASYEAGRDDDGLVQPMTLYFRMTDVKRAAFEAYIREHPDQWMGVHGLWDLVQKAARAGDLDLTREDILLFGTPHRKEVAVNCSRVIRVMGTDVWDLTYAELESRRQVRAIAAFLKKYVPGFEDAYNVQSGSVIGVRETRRIVGDYRLTAEDMLRARTFSDVIARGTYPIDMHNPEGKGTVLVNVPEGKAYDIPLRCLLPRGIDGLLVAGRCISGTHEAHSSYRVMPISMATGQAAGVCGALAALTRRQPREVPVPYVQDELLRQGANLGR